MNNARLRFKAETCEEETIHEEYLTKIRGRGESLMEARESRSTLAQADRPKNQENHGRKSQNNPRHENGGEETKWKDKEVGTEALCGRPDGPITGRIGKPAKDL